VRLPVSSAKLTLGPRATCLDLKPELSGYAWLVPYGNEIGVGLGGRSPMITRAMDLHLNECSEAIGVDLLSLAEGRIEGAPVPCSGPSRPLFGDGFLLIGDAGGFVSPASGEGMSLAISSAVAAASVLKLAFARRRYDRRSLRHYERFLRQEMPDFPGLVRLRDALSGDGLISKLDALSGDLERLVLIAPLVGPPSTAGPALELLHRLESR
jgi:flavin-dependent dehydrogenase